MTSIRRPGNKEHRLESCFAKCLNVDSICIAVYEGIGYRKYKVMPAGSGLTEVLFLIIYLGTFGDRTVVFGYYYKR